MPKSVAPIGVPSPVEGIDLVKCRGNYSADNREGSKIEHKGIERYVQLSPCVEDSLIIEVDSSIRVKTARNKRNCRNTGRPNQCRGARYWIQVIKAVLEIRCIDLPS